MNSQPNRRGSCRLPPRGNLRVICRKGALDLGPNLAVQLLDLSETGVRLLVMEALPPGQEVSVGLESAASGRRVQRVGAVAWAVPVAGGGCCVGLRLEKRLAYADLDYFARL